MKKFIIRSLVQYNYYRTNFEVEGYMLHSYPNSSTVRLVRHIKKPESIQIPHSLLYNTSTGRFEHARRRTGRNGA